jgi:type I restriction enzyme S subunit
MQDDPKKARLSDIADINPETLDSRTPPSFRFPYIDISAVSNGVIDWSKVGEEEFATAPSRARRIVLAGDSMLSTVRPQLLSHAFADWREGERKVCSTGFAVLRPNHSEDARLLFHLLFSDPLISQYAKFECGTGYPALNERDLPRFELPWPDADQRRRMAVLLDAMDAAIELTSEAYDRALRLRRAILQRFHRDALGPISSADRPGKAIKSGWRLVPTGELLAEEPKNGVSPPAESQPPGNPTFSIAAVRDGRIDLRSHDHLKYVRIEPRIATKYAVRKGDILVVRGNANPDLVGKCGMISGFPEGCIYPDILKRIVFADREDGVLPRYAALVWNHPLVHNQVLKRAKTSNGTLKINSRDVKQIILPVPPKNEQLELLKLIDTQESLAESLSGKVNGLLQLKRGLMQDLLTGKVRVPATLEVAGA